MRRFISPALFITGTALFGLGIYHQKPPAPFFLACAFFTGALWGNILGHPPKPRPGRRILAGLAFGLVVHQLALRFWMPGLRPLPAISLFLGVQLFILSALVE